MRAVSTALNNIMIIKYVYYTIIFRNLQLFKRNFAKNFEIERKKVKGIIPL